MKDTRCSRWILIRAREDIGYIFLQYTLLLRLPDSPVLKIVTHLDT